MRVNLQICDYETPFKHKTNTNEVLYIHMVYLVNVRKQNSESLPVG